MSRSACLCAFLLFTIACGDDDGGDAPGGSTSQAATSTEGSSSSTGTGSGATTDPTATVTSTGTAETGTSSSSSSSSGPETSGVTGSSGSNGGSGSGSDTGAGLQCFPDGGIYGSCAENPTCQCLTGANVYQTCTISCADSVECGQAADFPGAMPGCFPLNPGVADMICALVCQSEADCPCGLPCMPSGVPNVSICAEAQ